MSFFLAPTLGVSTDGRNPCYGTAGLFGEINKKYPNRDHASDGWIGDPSHAARVSDHNPDWGARGKFYGIVRAIDIDSNGAPGVLTPLVKDVLNAAIGDPRVWYVIWNSKIYSRTNGWVAKRYLGTNPHDHHVHISLLHEELEFSTAAWLEAPPLKVKAAPVSVANVRQQFKAAKRGQQVVTTNGVARIQKVLVNRDGEKLTVDGLVGKATLEAWGRWERKHDGKGQDQIPDEVSLKAFAKGRFRLIDAA